MVDITPRERFGFGTVDGIGFSMNATFRAKN